MGQSVAEELPVFCPYSRNAKLLRKHQHVGNNVNKTATHLWFYVLQPVWFSLSPVSKTAEMIQSVTSSRRNASLGRTVVTNSHNERRATIGPLVRLRLGGLNAVRGILKELGAECQRKTEEMWILTASACSERRQILCPQTESYLKGPLPRQLLLEGLTLTSNRPPKFSQL